MRTVGDSDWGENLNYFCLVVRPGLDDELRPHVTVQERFRLDGRQAPAQPAREARLSPVVPDVFMLGSQLPPSAFRLGGSYTLKATVKDGLRGSDRATELPLHLPPKVGE